MSERIHFVHLHLYFRIWTLEFKKNNKKNYVIKTFILKILPLVLKVPEPSSGSAGCCRELSAASRNSFSATWNQTIRIEWKHDAQTMRSWYLRAEGQASGVVRVNDTGVRVKYNALAWRLKGSSAHGHQQISYLQDQQHLSKLGFFKNNNETSYSHSFFFFLDEKRIIYIK